MYIVLGILVFIIMLTVIVSIHEFGHLVMAKKYGVYAYEYSIGMGPIIWQKPKWWGETTLSFRWLPIGGYVRMAGEDDDEEKDKGISEELLQGKRLDDKSAGQQTLIMVAGVVMNFILALVLFTTYNLVTPNIVTTTSEPVIGEIAENSPADKAGLQMGDRILKVESNGKTLEPKADNDIAMFVQEHTGESTYTVQRGSDTLTVQMQPVKTKYGYLLGYNATQTVNEDPTISDRLSQTVNDVATITDSVVDSMGMLGRGKGYESMSGPVGMADMMVTILQTDPLWTLYLSALISLNLGIFNLLPIPALDGGRIVLLWLNKLFRGKISDTVLNAMISLSFVALMGLMVFIFWNDIVKLFM